MTHITQKRLARLALLMATPFLILGCQPPHPSHRNLPTHSNKFYQYNRPVSVDRLLITGAAPLHINLATSKQNKAIISTNNPNIIHFTQLKNNTLQVSADNTSGSAAVNISAPNLKQLEVNNGARVYGYNIKSNGGLAIIQRGHSHINLSGNINVRTIEQTGGGWLKLGWLNSQRVTVHSTNGTITLAGAVNRLYGTFSGNAKFDARFLRAQKIWLKTFDNVCASVLPVYALNAFADDQSIIYYYKHPKHLDNAARHHGNILLMQRWQ